MPETKPQLFIIGLDAATWDLLTPWIAEGRMPNLARLVKEGVSGPLQSILPPITPPAWTTFMTGKNPGKHGIFHFIETEPGGYTMTYANGGSRRTPTLWRMLNDAGLTVGTVNIPFTYPPEKLNGFQISGMDTPSDASPFIHPQSLREELEAKVGPLLRDVRHLGFMTSDDRRGQVLAEMAKIDAQWIEAHLHLLERHRLDVMMFTFMSIDTVQHYFLQYQDPTHFLYEKKGAERFGTAVRDVYERLDAAVGLYLERIPPDANVVVVSDHGAGAVSDRIVYLNRYLAQLGLLHYKADETSAGKTVVKRAVRGLYQFLVKSLSSRQKTALANLLPGLRKKLETSATAFASIDWSRTKAYCSEVLASPPSIWINLKGVKPEGIVDPSEYESLLETITAKLQELKDPRTGEQIVHRVYRREELFDGPFAKEGADLILDWWSPESLFATKPSFPEDIGEPAVVIREPGPTDGSEWGGTHRLHGIVIAKGKPFRKDAKVEGARLIDMTPTLLHLMRQPIPTDIDGKVLVDLFDPGFMEANPIRTTDVTGSGSGGSTYSAEEAADVEERLRALGYLE